MHLHNSWLSTLIHVKLHKNEILLPRHSCVQIKLIRSRACTMAFPFLQSLQDEAQRFGGLLKKRRGADTRLNDARQPISSMGGFKEKSNRLKIPSIARHSNRPNAPIAVRAPEARIRICPVCETLVQPTLPDTGNPPEAPAIEYKLIAQVRSEEERHNWSTCALYNLVADQELDLTDNKREQYANYRGHTCFVSQLGGSFELCCEPGMLSVFTLHSGTIRLVLIRKDCVYRQSSRRADSALGLASRSVVTAFLKDGSRLDR